MSNGSKEGVDRRDFIISSLATVGASAALAATAAVADAKDSAIPVGAAASHATVYTGDMIEGKKVSACLTSTTWSRGKWAPPMARCPIHRTPP